jgi:mannose-6-phosphate isomerase-like protein (cupin superfamily)
MINRVFPSLSDYENLSRLRVESSEFANDFDYNEIVVNKPWGYEYLWYQSETVAIWFLKITKGKSTSLHCHAKKRTSLVVLKGLATCSTINDKFNLAPLDCIVLEPCVFHTSAAITEDIYLLEIETPPMKGDLVRMHDNYGREGSGYEKANDYSRDLDKFEFHPYDRHTIAPWIYGDIQIDLFDKTSLMNKVYSLIIPVNDYEKLVTGQIVEIGESSNFKHEEIEQNEDRNNRYFVFSLFSES